MVSLHWFGTATLELAQPGLIEPLTVSRPKADVVLGEIRVH